MVIVALIMVLPLSSCHLVYVVSMTDVLILGAIAVGIYWYVRYKFKMHE